jgi:hypothetical protein
MSNLRTNAKKFPGEGSTSQLSDRDMPPIPVKRSKRFHSRGILITIALLTLDACFRWEVSEINDARTSKLISRYNGVVPPWQPCGATGGGTLINFHVRHWLCYGLIKVEARGQTM